MEILGGVKPELVSLFSSDRCAPVSIDVGLNSPLPPPYISQELEVQFVVGLREYIPIRHLQFKRNKMRHARIIIQRGVVWKAYVEGNDDAGGVVRRELDGGAEESMEIEVLGGESGT